MIKVLDALRSVPFLKPLDDATLAAVAERCVEKVFLKGETVFLEGDTPKGLLVVRQGMLKIFKTGDGGREQILELEGPGRSVAELPLFDGLPYPASCAALEDAVVLQVLPRDFRELLDRHPTLSRAIIATLSMRLRRMVMLVRELSLRDVRGRLGDLLLQMAGPGNRVELPMSQQELASRIGTVREIVSRTLAKMAQEGVVRVEGRTVEILDRERLKA